MTKNIPHNAYIMIIGAMKCGTTSFYNYLSGHPEICGAITKEPNYFSQKSRKDPDIADYNDLWSFNRLEHKYVIEASTSYTKYPWEPGVPKNIHDYGIKPKFIYILRNPFDRITSHFNYMRKSQPLDFRMDDYRLINCSNYFLQLEQYRKYFSLSDILVLDFDELRDNPASILEKTYDFLNLSPRYFPDRYEMFNTTQIDSKLIPLLKYAPDILKPFGKRLLRKISPPIKFEMTPRERNYIYTELKDDMADLYKVYGIEVRKWGFDL